MHQINLQTIENNVNVVLFYVVYGMLLLSLLFSFYNDIRVDPPVTTNEN